MMKRLALLIVVCVVVHQFPLISSLERHSRSKRGVLDLIVTLWCYREKLKVPLLGINLYGCYCGTGGSGVPVDAVDKCCFLHDCCYHHSRVFLKCHSKVKWQLYHFSCHRSQTKCTSLSVCGRMACECDKQFAECLTQARPNKKHFFYNRKDLCPGPKDTCPAIYPNATEISYKTRASAHEQYMKQLLQRKKRNNKQKLSHKELKN